ncbi:hypothetical protein [Gemmatimonas sp.]|uniref:hypothetical protein n=1 Tax=Gemmatimonas sp. TaxID=1962908 RepID=UPI003561D883
MSAHAEHAMQNEVDPAALSERRTAHTTVILASAPDATSADEVSITVGSVT